MSVSKNLYMDSYELSKEELNQIQIQMEEEQFYIKREMGLLSKLVIKAFRDDFTVRLRKYSAVKSETESLIVVSLYKREMVNNLIAIVSLNKAKRTIGIKNIKIGKYECSQLVKELSTFDYVVNLVN